MKMVLCLKDSEIRTGPTEATKLWGGSAKGPSATSVLSQSPTLMILGNFGGLLAPLVPLAPPIPVALREI